MNALLHGAGLVPCSEYCLVCVFQRVKLPPSGTATIRRRGIPKGQVFNFSDPFFSVSLIWPLKSLGKKRNSQKSTQYSPQVRLGIILRLSWIWLMLGEIRPTERVNTKLAHKLEFLSLGLRVVESRFQPLCVIPEPWASVMTT